MKYFINEKRMLKELLNNPKSIMDDTYTKLILLVKYYKSEKHTKSQIRDDIDDFMYKHYQGFVMADWDNILQSIVKKYSKRDMCDFKDGKLINIAYSELEFIKTKQNLETEKLLFILLTLAKANYNDKYDKLWLNIDSTYIFKLSKYKYDKNKNCKTRMEQRELKINDLIGQGLIDILRMCESTDLILKYGNINKDDGIKFTLDDESADSIVYNYLRGRGDTKVKECQECGKLIYQNSKKPQLYCEKCGKKIKMKQDRENNKEKYRNSRI